MYLLLDLSGGLGFTKSRRCNTNAFLLFSKNCDDKIVSAPLVVMLDINICKRSIQCCTLDLTLPVLQLDYCEGLAGKVMDI